ncbi:MAG: peptide-methionine (S)-S-oxide reductase [Candidatus Omnitrophica bacterium CG11_big_fil_rev_8_21_14_0_20_64_10]|nr:MAG: peptide-methionine (S)-S-oxide reductase [Candidatus Omnitrophica bacterium CG11_big_fil_rev_8_21_14_0_20_64_10]
MEGQRKATFAAGCFWGVEKIFSKVPGVISTQVGYTGGDLRDPGYYDVTTGKTGHAEAIEIIYDPAKVSYGELLTVFWQWHDPTTPNRQGPDIGSQYRSAIFFHDETQRALAEQSKRLLEEAHVFDGPIVTEIAPAGPFYRAEEVHQQYLEKNPFGYCSHKIGSPRIRDVLSEIAVK